MDFGLLLIALCGGFLEQYFEYGPGIQLKGPSRHPKGAAYDHPHRDSRRGGPHPTEIRTPVHLHTPTFFATTHHSKNISTDHAWDGPPQFHQRSHRY